MENKPQNLLTSSHFLGVMALFYVSAVNPIIDKFASNTLSRSDIITILNSFVVAVLTGSSKLSDKNVYTPKILPGRNKTEVSETIIEDITNTALNTSSPIVSTLQEVTKTPIKSIQTLVDTQKEVNLLPNIYDNKNLGSLYITAKKDTWYKTSIIDSSRLDDLNKIFVFKGTSTNIQAYKLNLETNHCEFVVDNINLYAYIPHITVVKDYIEVDPFKDVTPKDSNFRPTKEQCNSLFNTTVTDKEYNDLIDCLNKFNINTKLDVAHFLAQIGHESAGLKYSEELASGLDYEFREDLGNIYQGDGPKYKGAGFIQLTGRHNYQNLSNYLNDPRVMEGVEYVAQNLPFTSAGYWWYSNNMSSFINDKSATVKQVTYKVNGGYNGLKDRTEYFEKAKELFNIK